MAWLFLVSWAPEPNSAMFLELKEELQSRPAQELPSTVTVTSVAYPELAHYVSSLGAFGYAFFGGWIGTRKSPEYDA